MIEDKITEYESFVNEVLRNDLKKVMARQQNVCQQIADYLKVKSVIDGIKQNSFVESPEHKLKLMCDIGSNFYVQCDVANSQRIYVHTGLGFYVELTLDEANSFIEKRETYLNQQLDDLSNQSSKIKAHIKLVIETLSQLQNLSCVDKKL